MELNLIMISEYLDFDMIKKKYPNLIYDITKNIISGSINICKNCNDEIISGCYDLLIDFNKSSIPYVYDVGKKIKRSYEHCYSDRRLCLATDIEQLLFIRNTKSICLWIEKYVESYYISYEYFQKYSKKFCTISFPSFTQNIRFRIHKITKDPPRQVFSMIMHSPGVQI